ncbi:hypothetical protein PghCCS26_23380 [Paenibacillus glycanilyticus]|uniref:Glycoside hydrolase family 5 domain-containing protein n=1 Tax=Paenibacillus glycanilyticus TaxID=126569 RepID=A0ABQ6NM73_9BACL|nr:cellulase family glycosylhydrolase [Paenibacillus glycanilyticus]GMK45210.1 hypothetical protein PghCCS26_23380 [Paenibacillus glycanilyticus]
MAGRLGDVNGFVKRAGQKIVNGAGHEILLRGVGFGSWLLPEGYMWKFPEAGDRPRRIEKMVRELIGEEKATSFWEIYYDTYIAEADIRRIAEEGFNSVRFPINWRFLMAEGTEQYNEKHLALLDRAIGWCREHKLYVVLDLHGAPGGQTGANIDDSENDKPELFLNDDYRKLAIDIWRMLAERYKDEWIVAGYDLLNEPLPDWNAQYNDRLMPLYKEMAAAIREVDERHMIIIEGAHWATDWSVFDEVIDDNLMLQFHKYWNSPDTASIQKFLDKREELNLPIYMGEGGENNIEWYTGAFRLYEDHNISWNFWTWKKLSTTNSPCSVMMPEGWDKLVAYLNGGEKPSAEEAEQILWAYLDNLALDRCVYHPEVVRSLLFRTPIRIPAIFYGYYGEGISYGVGERTVRKLGFRDEDGTDIRFTDSERETAHFQHGGGQSWEPQDWLHVRLAPGDWLVYELYLPEGTELEHVVTVRAKAIEGEAVAVIRVNNHLAGICAFTGTEWQETTAIERVTLASGRCRVTIKAEGGPLAVEWVRLECN